MYLPRTNEFLDYSELPDAPLFTRRDVLQELKDFVSRFPTQEEAAAKLEISRVFLWRVINGHKPPSQKILEKLGFYKEVRQAEFYYRQAA